METMGMVTRSGVTFRGNKAYVSIEYRQNTIDYLSDSIDLSPIWGNCRSASKTRTPAAMV